MLLTVSAIFVLKNQIGTDSSQLVQLIPVALNSFQIKFYEILYGYVATKVTEYENHRTIAEHNSQRFKKLTIFHFLNSYAVLFYIAFVKGDCNDVLSGSSYCGRELGLQTLSTFIFNDFFTRISRFQGLLSTHA